MSKRRYERDEAVNEWLESKMWGERIGVGLVVVVLLYLWATGSC